VSTSGLATVVQHAPRRPTEHPERLVIIALLGRLRGRRRDSLYRSLGLSRDAIDKAITSLEHAGLVVTTVRMVRASSALVRLDWLNMVGV
jgi:DNA-binding transcriptional ArsR family regulator